MRILSRLNFLKAISLVGLLALGFLLAWSVLEFRMATAKNQLVTAIQDNVFNASSLRDQYFLYRDERSKEQWDSRNREATELIAQAMFQFQDPVDRQVLKNLQRNMDNSAGIFQRIVDNTKLLQTPGQHHEVQEELDKRLLSQLLVQTGLVHDASAALLKSDAVQVAQAYRRVVLSIAVGALVLTLVVILTLFFLDRLIRLRLTALHTGVKVVASGQLDFRLEEQGADELAEVAQSINFMTKELQGVAERKRAETVLLESERVFRNLLSNIQLAAVMLDLQGQVTFCNDFFLELTGWQRAEVIGQNWFKCFLPEAMRAQIEGDFGNGIQNGSVVAHHENEVITRRGELRQLAWDNVVLRGAHDHIVGTASVGVDVTERKRVERGLRLAASVFSHAREGITITDASGTIVDVNDTFIHVTGYSREEVIGQNPRFLRSGRQGPEFYATMWRALIETGHWYGELWNRRKNGEVFAELINISAVRDSAGKTQNYVALFTDITPFKEHQQQLERIAHYDALTKLPNRVLLIDRLHQAIAQSQRRERCLAVVYLDLDGFKEVNDGHGHDIGDELLIAVAQRMNAALREGETLARIGGDEFVAVLLDLERPQDCEPVLQRLLQAAADPVTVGDVVLQVSASIGVTHYPQDCVEADLLLRHADYAMYQAKQGGKNRYHLFDGTQRGAPRR